MTEESNIVEEIRQRVIAMVTEARARIERQAERAAEIRADEDLEPARKEQALGEVTREARTRATNLIRDARSGVASGWAIGSGGLGVPVRPWDEGLEDEGLAAQSAMLGYIDSAERVFAMDLAELETGEAPPSAVVAERDAAATEVASYEEAHPAPAGVIPARDRWESIG